MALSAFSAAGLRAGALKGRPKYPAHTRPGLPIGKDRAQPPATLACFGRPTRSPSGFTSLSEVGQGFLSVEALRPLLLVDLSGSSHSTRVSQTLAPHL